MRMGDYDRRAAASGRGRKYVPMVRIAGLIGIAALVLSACTGLQPAPNGGVQTTPDPPAADEPAGNTVGGKTGTRRNKDQILLD